MTKRPASLVFRILLLTAALSAHNAFAQCTLPSFSTIPQNATPANPGVTITLSGSSPNATSYQWYKNGGIITGATGTMLTLTNVEQGKDGGSYVLQARNACGSTAAVRV